MTSAVLVPGPYGAPVLHHASAPGNPASLVKEIAQATAKLVVGELLKAGAAWTVGGAVWLLGRSQTLITDATSPDLGSDWFGTGYVLMAEIAAAVVLPLLCCAAIQAVYRQSASGLLRAFGVNLPLAMLLTGVAVSLVRLSMAAVDAMSAQVVHSVVTNDSDLFVGLAGALTALLATGNGFAVFVIGIVAALAALVLWFELVLRAAAIAVTALFLPLVLAGLVWPACAHWCRRLAETLAALVLSKLVIVVVLALGIGAVDSGLHHLDLGTTVLGVTMLLLAVMAPFTLLRLVPAVEGAAVSHLESTRNRAIGEPLRLGHDYAMALASGGAGAATTATASTGAATTAGAGTAGAGAAGTSVGEEPTVGVGPWTDGPTGEEVSDDHPDLRRHMAIVQGEITPDGRPAAESAGDPFGPLGVRGAGGDDGA